MQSAAGGMDRTPAPAYNRRMRIQILNPGSAAGTTGPDRGGGARLRLARHGDRRPCGGRTGRPRSRDRSRRRCALAGLLEQVVRGESEGVAGHVIAAFDDPGLDAARSLARAPVVGIGEAAFHLASLVAGRCVVTTHVHTVPLIEGNLARIGLCRPLRPRAGGRGVAGRRSTIRIRRRATASPPRSTAPSARIAPRRSCSAPPALGRARPLALRRARAAGGGRRSRPRCNSSSARRARPRHVQDRRVSRRRGANRCRPASPARPIEGTGCARHRCPLDRSPRDRAGGLRLHGESVCPNAGRPRYTRPASSGTRPRRPGGGRSKGVHDG